MSSSDPSNFITSPPSTYVKIHSTSQESMNGKFAIVAQFDSSKQRYLCQLMNGTQVVSLKPDNLRKCSTIETYQAQYQQVSQDPRFRAEISKYYNMANDKLPPGVTPEYAAIGSLLVIIGAIYFLGFTRVMVGLSLLMMIGLLLAQDLMSGASPQVIARNFPFRCREMLEQTLPFLKGKLNDKVAMGLVLGFMLITGRTLFLPPKPAGAAAAAASGNLMAPDEAYRLGFEDSAAGREFGSSMPIGATLQSDPVDYTSLPFSPAASKPWYSKMGVWQLFSAYNVFRTLNTLGRDVHGIFSPQLMLANLQNADMMQLGLLAFSVYNIFKVFL